MPNSQSSCLLVLSAQHASRELKRPPNEQKRVQVIASLPSSMFDNALNAENRSPKEQYRVSLNRFIGTKWKTKKTFRDVGNIFWVSMLSAAR